MEREIPAWDRVRCGPGGRWGLAALMACGPVFAADLSAPAGAVPAYFAREIIATPAAPARLGTAASTATQLGWRLGYGFSAGEVRHARVACSPQLRFDPGTTIVSDNPAAISIGAVNGLGTQVLTFSLTAHDPANLVSASDRLVVVGDHRITGTGSDVACSVALYDQPSQALAGGEAGRIPGSVSSGTYLAFVPSIRLVAHETVDVADVAASPPFGNFVTRAPVTFTSRAGIGSNGASGISLGLRDPDGAGGQAAPFGIDGAPLTLPQLLAPSTTLSVRGDFSATASAGAVPFDAAARARTWLVVSASALDGSVATYPVGNLGFANAVLELHRRNGNQIHAADYHATLHAVPADPAVYAVDDITGVRLGAIVRNGTQLQAPLVQVPAGWQSRLVLSNTDRTDLPFVVHVRGEAGNAITTGPLSGVVPARGTLVIEDLRTLLTGFTGNPRATLDVVVAGPGDRVQGLYQIVHPERGSISQHVLVRASSN